MSEHQNIEYKTNWHDDHLKAVCGFANANGGTLYIGREEKGKKGGGGGGLEIKSVSLCNYKLIFCFI